MKNYEAMFILKPDLVKEELEALCQKISDNIKKYKGEIESAGEWGRKKLAYKIKKQSEGIYYIVKLKIAPLQVKPLSADFDLNESILRVMFTAL